MVPRGAVETYKTSEYHMQNSYSFWGLPRIIRKRIRRYDNRDFRLCLYDFICIINVAWLNAKVMEMVTTVSFEITTYDYASPDYGKWTFPHDFHYVYILENGRDAYVGERSEEHTSELQSQL